MARPDPVGQRHLWINSEDGTIAIPFHAGPDGLCTGIPAVAVSFHRASIAREDAMGREMTRNDERQEPSRNKAFRVFPQVSDFS